MKYNAAMKFQNYKWSNGWIWLYGHTMHVETIIELADSSPHHTILRMALDHLGQYGQAQLPESAQLKLQQYKAANQIDTFFVSIPKASVLLPLSCYAGLQLEILRCFSRLWMEAQEQEDLFDAEDFDRLPCSWNYVVVCILMSALSGQMNALLFPAYTLHFEDMGWPLIRAGMAVTIGFVSRVLVQQLTLRAGYWLAVPLSMIHLTFAILALIFTTSEWAVFAQIVCVFGIDPGCAIEGIAFDAFGASEVQARQATSTCLSVWTMNQALSCTIGGLIYDSLGWFGIATYHSACEGLLLFLLCLQPHCRQSFIQAFFKGHSDVVPESSTLENELASKEGLFTHVVPGTTGATKELKLSGNVEDLQIEEAEGSPAMSEPRMSPSMEKVPQVSQVRVSSSDRRSRRSGRSIRSTCSAQSQGTKTTAGTAKSGKSDAQKSAGTMSAGTFKTKHTGWTSVTRQTAKTVLTAFTKMTALSEAGEHFRHHFGTRNVLLPEIAGATGAERVMREVMDEDEGKIPARAGIGAIPADVRLPALLIVLTAFLNNCVYAMEFATFAIYFKQVHNWKEATLASIAQTAGDLVAAIAMQVIPALFTGGYDPDEAGCVRRSFHHITSQPYNLSFILATWILFNFGMLSPILALAIVAQILMGTSYVYCSKWVTDINLFYSFGDSKVFLSLQVICRNAEALGGGLAGILALLRLDFLWFS
eukprot:s69_g2.t3